MIALLTHEVGGHWARGKEFGDEGQSISISFLHGAVSCGKRFDAQRESLRSLAGNEATYVLSEKLQMQGMRSARTDGQMGFVWDPVSAATYIFSAGNQTFYVYWAKPKNGHDMEAHISDMGKHYGGKALHYQDLRSAEWMNLLDPMLLFSFWSAGKGEAVNVPMISLMGIGFLPSLRVVYTPYNTIEKRLVVHFKTSTTPGRCSVGSGGGSYSAELAVDRLFSVSGIDVGCTLAHWRQPELPKPAATAEKKAGFLAEATLLFAMRRGASLMLGIGAKTAGYVMGRPLEATMFVRGGLGWAF